MQIHSVSLSVCMSACLPFFPSVFLFFFIVFCHHSLLRLFIYLYLLSCNLSRSVSLYLYLFLFMSVCLSVCLCLSVSLSVFSCLFLSLSVYVFPSTSVSNAAKHCRSKCLALIQDRLRVIIHSGDIGDIR